jgi:hypothetical protein
MDPPGSVVVPEVMIRVLCVDFDAKKGQRGLEGCGTHVDASPFLTHPDAGTKKPPTHSCAGGWPAESIVRVRIFLSRTSEKDLGSLSSHREFLLPRLADLHLAMEVLGMLVRK